MVCPLIDPIHSMTPSLMVICEFSWVTPGSAWIVAWAMMCPVGVRLAGVASGVFAATSTVFYLLGVQADATPAVVTASMFPAVTVVVGRFVYHDDVVARQVGGIGLVVLGVIGVAVG